MSEYSISLTLGEYNILASESDGSYSTIETMDGYIVDLISDWILADGTWNDNNYWIDTHYWID